MCTTDNVVAGIIIASGFVILAGAVITMLVSAIDDYLYNKNKRKNK
jgi:hypothetical protein